MNERKRRDSHSRIACWRVAERPEESGDVCRGSRREKKISNTASRGMGEKGGESEGMRRRTFE